MTLYRFQGTAPGCMKEHVLVERDVDPDVFECVTVEGREYQYPPGMPEFANPRKGRGRGAERDTVTSWSLPLEGTAMAKNMPPIELNGGSYDADGIPHFESPVQYDQYAKRTETEDGQYECT